MKSFTELELRVIRWAEARKIIPTDNAGQVMHQITDHVEFLGDAHCEDNKEAVKRAVGMAVAALIVYCDLSGTSIRECLDGAYSEFKNVEDIELAEAFALLINK